MYELVVFGKLFKVCILVILIVKFNCVFVLIWVGLIVLGNGKILFCKMKCNVNCVILMLYLLV